jgi:exodeoxyribonuclease-1
VSDVRATIALARLIKQKQPKLFDFYLALHKKDRVLTEMKLPALPAHAQPFIHVSGMFPAERGCMAVMWPLATHPTNKNEIIAWDVSAGAADSSAADPRVLLDLKPEEIRQRLFTKQADLPEGVARLPIKSVHVNKSPFVLGSRNGEFKTFTPEIQAKWGVNLDQCLANAALARDLPDMSLVWSAVFARPKNKEAPRADGSVEASDVDAALYEGFTNDSDRRTLLQLLKQSPEALANRHPAFEDARLDQLFWRYRCRNFPATLSAEDHEDWQRHCHERLVDGAQGTRSFTQYFAQIEQLEVNLDKALQPNEAGKSILTRLREYGESLRLVTA